MYVSIAVGGGVLCIGYHVRLLREGRVRRFHDGHGEDEARVSDAEISLHSALWRLARVTVRAVSTPHSW